MNIGDYILEKIFTIALNDTFCHMMYLNYTAPTYIRPIEIRLGALFQIASMVTEETQR